MRVTDNRKNVTYNHKWAGQRLGGAAQSEEFPSIYRVGDLLSRDDIRSGDGVTPLPYAATYLFVPPLSTDTLKWTRNRTNALNPTDKYSDIWLTPISYYPVGPSAPDPTIELTRLRGLVETRLLSKAVNVTSNLVIALAERKKTSALLTSIVQSVNSQTRAFIRKDWATMKNLYGKSRRDFVKNSANRHLAFIYGILPLIDTANGLLQYLGEPLTFKVRARQESSLTTKSFFTASRKASAPNDRREDWVPAIITSDITQELSARGVMRFEIKSFATRQAQALGVLTPTLAFYDSIALSFVASWFSNITAYITALDSNLSVSPLNFSVTTLAVTTTQREAVPIYKKLTETFYPSTYVHEFSGKASSTKLERSMKRTVGVCPSASLHLQNNFSTFAALASVSLLAQRYLGRFNQIARKGPQFRYRPTYSRNLPPITYKPTRKSTN